MQNPLVAAIELEKELGNLKGQIGEMKILACERSNEEQSYAAAIKSAGLVSPSPIKSVVLVKKTGLIVQEVEVEKQNNNYQDEDEGGEELNWHKDQPLVHDRHGNAWAVIESPKGGSTIVEGGEGGETFERTQHLKYYANVVTMETSWNDPRGEGDNAEKTVLKHNVSRVANESGTDFVAASAILPTTNSDAPPSKPDDIFLGLTAATVLEREFFETQLEVETLKKLHLVKGDEMSKSKKGSTQVSNNGRSTYDAIDAISCLADRVAGDSADSKRVGERELFAPDRSTKKGSKTNQNQNPCKEEAPVFPPGTPGGVYNEFAEVERDLDRAILDMNEANDFAVKNQCRNKNIKHDLDPIVVQAITDIVNDRINEVIDQRLLNSLFEHTHHAQEPNRSQKDEPDTSSFRLENSQIFVSDALNTSLNTSAVNLAASIDSLQRFSVTCVYLVTFTLVLCAVCFGLGIGGVGRVSQFLSRVGFGFAETFYARDQIYGSSPQFQMVSGSDEFCFDGYFFGRGCHEKESAFTFNYIGGGSRFGASVEIVKLKNGAATGECLQSSKKNELILGRCLENNIDSYTMKEDRSNRQMWYFDNGVLRLRKTERDDTSLCLNRRVGGNVAYLAKCNLEGFHEIRILVDRPGWLSWGLRKKNVSSWSEILKSIETMGANEAEIIREETREKTNEISHLSGLFDLYSKRFN